MGFRHTIIDCGNLFGAVPVYFPVCVYFDVDFILSLRPAIG